MIRRALCALLIAAAGARPARAQLAPDADWHTIVTPHFRVHFAPPLETAARRAAADAEVAYAQLSRELTPPRGPIDLVISDDVDLTNGYATPFPTNRIVVYANPPVNETALRYTDDPDVLVITHELTHVFHLDRSRGVWNLAQHVFGRAPFLFPNEYVPAWITEGLAVYYETRLTGTGRVTGSDHRMIARALAFERRLPGPDAVSIADAQFPYGLTPYVMGSLFMDYLARTRGAAHMRDYVELSANQLIPLWLNRPAREAFGISLSQAWKQWTDSITKSVGDPTLPVSGWRFLTADGGVASFPRWLGDTALSFTGSSGRESYGAFRVTTNGDLTGISRRNSASPTIMLAPGDQLFAQLEYVDAYHIRSDLFVKRGWTTRRLTTGERLSAPDARSDGRIVAVQTVPAGTRLVTLWADGGDERPITRGGLDEQWAEPRWSPDGRFIAAAHWLRGGTSEIVVLDTLGAVLQRIAPAHAIQSAPAWSPDGTRIYFTSDRTGTTNVYAAPFSPGAGGRANLQQLTDVGTGFFQPAVSPDGRWMAGAVVLGDGYHIGVAPFDRLAPHAPDTLSDAAKPRPAPPADSVTTPATRYSPWSTLWPRYWMPVAEGSIAGGERIGAFTSGSDVVGRHAYDAQLFVPTDNTGLTGTLDYAYAGLGMPVLVASASQLWENTAGVLSDQRVRLGTLRKRTRDAAIGAVFVRPRFRTYSSLTLSAGLESHDYATDPAPLIARIDSSFRRTYWYPRLLASAAWSNAQRPTLGISPEDGLSVAATARERFASGDASRETFSAVGVTSLYKSLDLPGFGHHVFALRFAAGASDSKATDYLEVGGTSGSVLSIIPGVVLGEGQRTFPVRGFQGASLVGLRAYTASAEYRLPLSLLQGGAGLLPFFLDRSSVSLFYDEGSAWCPAVLPNGAICRDPALTPHYRIASAGAELNVTAAVLDWDTPYRFRVGVALPTLGKQLVGAHDVSTYFTLGLSF